ncbi:hypothetical protein AVEN_23840-1 [Araneus ventricosus]|uniref:Uncharacterized protein n=1 Tax=Araneus ventricosus TaxID=182803 RepID=A0A4Y2A6U1_ARAVE|nr:hypothetical protein AVEN_23840-1 [Araneus ventricosus]
MRTSHRATAILKPVVTPPEIAGFSTSDFHYQAFRMSRYYDFPNSFSRRRRDFATAYHGQSGQESLPVETLFLLQFFLQLGQVYSISN